MLPGSWGLAVGTEGVRSLTIGRSSRNPLFHSFHKEKERSKEKRNYYYYYYYYYYYLLPVSSVRSYYEATNALR